jgi:uroporphyrinogen III methyltransferase/synthase
MGANMPVGQLNEFSRDSFALPRVFLVGAGPGNRGLLTVRAVECLAQAEVVIYDRLVPERLLDGVPQSAQRIAVDSLPGQHAERCPHIISELLAAAHSGKRVVRLKGGDPFLFGRGAEEAEALRQAGIPFEVVPGVTSALAAAAYAGIPLTHRLHASGVALVTGHECAGKAGAIDWAALARFPGTLVVYMGMKRLPQIVATLLEQGKPPQTPAALVRWGTTGEQRTITAALEELPARVKETGLTPPALIIIGEVVSLWPQLSWWEERPLFGKRVLVTRPRHQAEDLLRRLEELGAVAHALPLLEIREPADWSAVDHALATLKQFDWLVFTSSNGVHALIGRLRHLGRDLRALGTVQIAAIGPGTAEALLGYHLIADVVPPRFDSESLVECLRPLVTGKRVLLARADRGRELLREQLESVAKVEQVAVYSQVDASAAGSAGLRPLAEGNVDYVTVTSSNIARALHQAADLLTHERIKQGEIKLVSISPVTSATIRELNWPVAAEATEATTEGVVEAMVRLAGAAE